MLLTIITSKYIQESEPFVKRLFGSLIQKNGSAKMLHIDVHVHGQYLSQQFPFSKYCTCRCTVVFWNHEIKTKVAITRQHNTFVYRPYILLQTAITGP